MTEPSEGMPDARAVALPDGDVATLPPPPPPPAPEPDVPEPSPYAGAPLASIGARVGELFLDGILFGCTLGIGWVVWWIIAWDHGKTPARCLLRTRAVRAGSRDVASFGRMAIREALGKGVAGVIGAAGLYLVRNGTNAGRFLLAASLAYCAMSGVAALLDGERRALWDVFARTVVVIEPADEPMTYSAAAPAAPAVDETVVEPVAEPGEVSPEAPGTEPP